jgi:DNA-binding response OmpR family regulator
METSIAAIKILLVNDDEMQNTIMRGLLEREGFDITVCGQRCGTLEAHQLRTLRCAKE